MKQAIHRFLRDQSGATAIEYGIIVAMLAVGLIATLETFGGSLSNFFNNTASTVNAKTPS